MGQRRPSRRLFSAVFEPSRLLLDHTSLVFAPPYLQDKPPAQRKSPIKHHPYFVSFPYDVKIKASPATGEGQTSSPSSYSNNTLTHPRLHPQEFELLSLGFGPSSLRSNGAKGIVVEDAFFQLEDFRDQKLHSLFPEFSAVIAKCLSKLSFTCRCTLSSLVILGR